MKWKTLKGLLGAVSVAALGVVSPHKTDAQTPTFPIDLTINFKNYVNVRNGLAGLDANGNITASLLNNSRVGGSDTGTDISAALANGVPLKSAISECTQNPPTVYYGAMNSSSQMGNAANTANLRASGNTMPYFNISSIAATVYGAGGALRDVSGPIGISGFQNVLKTTGVNGIVELANTKYMTPSVPSKFWQNVLTSDGSQTINDQQMLTQTGFKPTIATFNPRREIDIGAISTEGPSYFTDNDVANLNTAFADIKNNIPSVKQVWPFIAAGRGHDWLTDDYWSSAKTLIASAGGVGLDMATGLYTINGPGFLADFAEEIKWANANGIKTLALLSPYSQETPAGYGSSVYPQWRYDSQFMQHVKNVVAWLKAADALPTAWAVVNYSPTQYYNPSTNAFNNGPCAGCEAITANLMGADNDSVNQTIAYVARWVAENAPTSTYTSMPDMGQATQEACTSTVLGGYKTTKPVISAGQLGLGSLAFTDYDKAILGYPVLQGGAELNGEFDVLGQNHLMFGLGATSQHPFIGWSTTYGGLEIGGGPLYIDTYNVNMTNGGSLSLSSGNINFAGNGKNGLNFESADNSKSTWIYGDTRGGLNIGTQMTLKNGGDINLLANMNTQLNLKFTGGTNGIDFVSADGTKWTWLSADGAGGVNIGHGINIATGVNGTVTMFNGATVDNNLLVNAHEISIGEFASTGTNSQLAFYTAGDNRATRTANIYTLGGYTEVPLSASLHVQGDSFSFSNMPISFDAYSDTTGAGVYEGNEYAYKVNNTVMSAFGSSGWFVQTPTHSGIVIGGTPTDALGDVSSSNTVNSYISPSDHDFYGLDANGDIFRTLHLNPTGSQIFTKLYGVTPTDSDYGITLATVDYVRSKSLSTVSTYANLPSSPPLWARAICTDCYSKLREGGDTSTGIVVMWNGSRWTDALGIAAQH